MKAPPLVTLSAPHGPTMSVEGWFALPEDQPGELVDGRLVEAEVPSWVHETVVLWFGERLRAWGRPLGARTAASGVKYALAADRGRMPDLSVFLPGRRPPADGLVREPPDLAIEVVSAARSDIRRDRVEKVQDYARFGIRWYWLVDPDLRTFEVLELRDGGYLHAGVADRGTVSDLPGCPGLVLELDDLWAELDSLRS